MWMLMHKDLLSPVLTVELEKMSPEQLVWACRDVCHAAEHLMSLEEFFRIQTCDFHVTSYTADHGGPHRPDMQTAQTVKLSMLNLIEGYQSTAAEMVQDVARILYHCRNCARKHRDINNVSESIQSGLHEIHATTQIFNCGSQSFGDIEGQTDASCPLERCSSPSSSIESIKTLRQSLDVLCGLFKETAPEDWGWHTTTVFPS